MTQGGSVGMPKGIAGYQTGGIADEKASVAYDGSPRDFSRDLRPDDISPQSAYENAIQSSAASFAKGGKDSLNRWENKELDTLAMNISYGHNREKQEVLQDLIAAIEQQSANMEPEQGIMDMIREKMGGSMDKFNQLGNAEDINFSPTGMMHGGIARLQDGGMAPELFEDEGIVDTSSMLNEIAAQESGDGIMSVSARGAPEAVPERGVPNERGIIELAMEPELAEEVEDDNPILAFAKQEAQSRLDEEFNILKSTAQAEAASGYSPSAVIKSSMDDLARSARRIETETVEKYPEVPMNANLISSDDLVSYREELVTIFETPEVGQEEPLMDTAILAKKGGLIPGYQDGGVSYAPGEAPDSVYKRGRIKAGDWGPGKKDYFAAEDISWMSQYAYGRELIEAVNNNEISVEDAKRLLADRIGPTLSEISSTYDSPQGIKRERERERKLERGKMDLSQLRAAAEADKDRDPREEEFLDALIKNEAGAKRGGGPLGLGRQIGNTGLLGSIKEATGRGAPPGTGLDRSMLLLQNPEFANLLNQYQRSKEPRQEIKDIEVTAKRRDAQTGDQVSTGTKEQKGPPQYDDGPAELSAADKLKKTYGDQIDTLVSGYSKNVTGYDEKADKQDEELLSIFDEMEAAIPERARLAGRRTPYTGGGAQSFLVRRTAGKQIEGELFEGLRLNKLNYYELRKKETEARREKDYAALTSLTEQKIKILSDIDLSVLDAKTARTNALELEEIKFNLNLDLELFKYNLLPENMDASLATIPTIIDNLTGFGERDIQAAVVAAAGAEAAVKFYGEVFEGAKTFKTKETGKTVTYTFPQMWRAYLGNGLGGGEIVTMWKKQPKG